MRKRNSASCAWAERSAGFSPPGRSRSFWWIGTKVHAANPQGFVELAGHGAELRPDRRARCKAATRWTYIVAGIASLLLAAFSLVLPHTPPKKVDEAAKTSSHGSKPSNCCKHPFVLVLWLVTFVDSFVHNCYFNWTGVFLGTPTTRVA